MKRRRLAALSEHMETRLVLSPLLGLSGRVATNVLRPANAASLSTAETQELSTADTDSTARDHANARTVTVNRNTARNEAAVDAHERQPSTNAVDEVIPVQPTLTNRVVVDEQPRLTTGEAVEKIPSDSPDTRTVVDHQPVKTLDNTGRESTAAEVVPSNDVTTTPVVITDSPVETDDVKTVINKNQVLRTADINTKPVRDAKVDSSASAAEKATKRADVETVIETVPADTVVVREVEVVRSEADSTVIENDVSTNRTDNNSDRASTDAARREVSANNSAVENAEPVVDEIDPVTQVVPVFDEATGTVRLGVADEAPALNLRVVVDPEADDQVSRERSNAETEVKVVTERPPTVEDIAPDPVEAVVAFRTEAPGEKVQVADRSTTDRGAEEIVDEAEEQREDLAASGQAVLRTAVGQPVPLVRGDAAMSTDAVEESIETMMVIETQETTTVVEESDADSGPANTEAEISSRGTQTESSTETSDQAEVQEAQSETSFTDESNEAPGVAAIVTRPTKATANDGERILRLSDEEPGRRVKDGERPSIPRTELNFVHQTRRMTTVDFDLSATGVEYMMRQHEATEDAASQTVFGDATRLGIMLAAIKTAGRRSGSQVLFSLTDDDARGDGGSGSTDRRRRERTKARRWESFRQRRGRGELPFDDIDESAAIPCSNNSVDSVFADSASMCVLFETPADGGEKAGSTSPLVGLLLGGVGVAAHQATKKRGKKSTARPELPVPQYSGDTIVFPD